MDKNNHDNSYELYSRSRPSQNVPTSSNGRNDGTAQRKSLPTGANTINSVSFDENPPSISTIDGNQPPSTRPPPVQRKRSRKGTDKSDRSALTSSFLRRKRNEYAGTNLQTFLFGISKIDS